jgi:hypothetical protein
MLPPKAALALVSASRQRQRFVDLARLRKQAADPDGRLAQPALDYSCRKRL